MSEDSKYTPLSARENISSSKEMMGPCILHPPKPKEDLSSTDLCIYPLSSMEEKIIGMFGEKHTLQCAEIDSEALMITITNIFHASSFESKCSPNTIPPESVLNIISQIRLCCNSDEGHRETVFKILDVVMKYTWEVKMVLILAAFVMSYSEFCFEMKAAVDPFARRSKRSTVPPRKTLSLNLTRFSNLVRNLLEVGTLMLKIKKNKDPQDMGNMEPKINKVLHSVIYQVIKILATCSSYMERVYENIMNITLDTEIKQQEKFLQELLDNQEKVTNFVNTTDREAAENFTPTEYRDVRRLFNNLFTLEKTQNGKVLIQIDFDELKGYTTAFLVSDLNARTENFTSVIETYSKIPRDTKFRLVWIPMYDQAIEWTDAEEVLFKKVASSMPWCCCHPLMVTKAFSNHIVKNWMFKKKSALVVFNEQAEVITSSALSVLETWGDKAYPFSRDMVATISKCWTMKKMVDDWDIDQLDWENDIICIFGGDNLEMLMSFTKCVERIIHKSNSIQIKTIYVGNNVRKENWPNIVASLEELNVKCLSKFLMSSFWKRLATVMKTRLGSCNAHDEHAVMKQLQTLFGYSEEELWTAMMFKGSTELVMLTGAPLLQCFEGFSETNTEINKTNELWECLVQNLTTEKYSTLDINVSACKRVRDLFGSDHQDVTDLLTKLFTKEMSISEGQIGLQHFKGKYIGFLVMKMNAKSEELTALVMKYNRFRKSQGLKIIWIPLVDTPGKEQYGGASFREKALSMGWYYCEPSMVTKDFYTYLMQDWYSQGESNLLILNKKGKLVSTLQWDTSTYPWEYQAGLEIQHNWLVYFPAKELTNFGQRDKNWKLLIATEYDGTRDVDIEMIEILGETPWDVNLHYDAKFVPNTMYESIFLVRLPEGSEGWQGPLYGRIIFPNGEMKDVPKLINDKPRGEWFEVQAAEFSCTPGKCDGRFMFYIFNGTRNGMKGIQIKGAGIREKK